MSQKSTFVLSLLFVLVNFLSNAQIQSKISLEKIKLTTLDPKSENFYPKLVNRLNKNDSTLTLIDYQNLYYGFAFQGNFNPLKNDIDTVFKLFAYKYYSKVINFCDSLIENNPTDLEALLAKSFALYELYGKENNLYLKINERLDKFLTAILATGDGLTVETAFYVRSISDEYLIMEYEFKIPQIKEQELKNGCDIMSIDRTPEFRHKKVVFNVSIILNYYNQIFAKHKERLFKPRRIEGYEYFKSITCQNAVISDDFQFIAIGKTENRITVYRLSNWDLVIDTVIKTKFSIRPQISYFSKDGNYYFASTWDNFPRRTTIDWRIDLKTGQIQKMKCKDTNRGCAETKTDKYLCDQKNWTERNHELYLGVFLFTMKHDKLDIYIEKKR